MQYTKRGKETLKCSMKGGRGVSTFSDSLAYLKIRQYQNI